MGSSIRRLPRHVGGSVRCVTGGAGVQTALSSVFSLGDGDTSFVLAFDALIVAPAVGSAIIAGVYSSVYSDGLVVYRNAGNLVAQVKAGGFSLPLAGIQAGWHQLVCVGDGPTRTVKVYVDGVLFGTGGAWAAGAFPATMRVYVGDAPNIGVGAGNAANVVFDQGHAWSAAQVLEYWRSGAYPQATRRWPLDDGGVAVTAREFLVGDLPMTFTVATAFSADAPALVRRSVRNHVIQPDVLTASPWTPSGGAYGIYSGTHPAAIGGMTTLTDNAGGLAFFSQTIPGFPAAAQGAFVIVSAYVTRVAGAPWIAVSSDGGANVCWFNVTTGAAGATGGGATTAIESTDVAGVYRITCAVFASQLTGVSTVRFYLVNGNGVVTHTLNDALAIGGVMFEIAAPGQTTPSPYVAPYSASAIGDSRQNLVLWSGDPSNGLYAKTGCTANASGDIVEDATGGRHRFYQSMPSGFLANVPFTVKARVTVGARRYFYYTVNDSGSEMAWFDTQGAGAVAYAAAGVTASIVQVSAGVFDCSMTVTAGDATANAAVSFGADTAFNGNGNYNGVNGQVALNVTRLQVTQGGTPGVATYVKTTALAYDLRGAPLSVYGKREYRQNGLAYSRALSKWSATAGVTATDNTTDVTDPLGGNTAAKVTYAGGGASGSYRLYTNSLLAPVAGAPFTISVWLRTASGTVSLRLANNQSLGSIVVTSSWQRFSLTLTWPSAAVSQQFLFYSENADNAAFTVYAWEAQSEQASRPGPNVTTNGAPANSSGAPRSVTP